MSEQAIGKTDFEILLQNYGVCMYDDGTEGGNISNETRIEEGKVLEYVERLEARLKLIEQRFDRYCRDGLELRGFTHLSADSSEIEQLTFNSLYQAIKPDRAQS